MTSHLLIVPVSSVDEMDLGAGICFLGRMDKSLCPFPV